MDVTIYTTPFCPFCIMAKRLLKEKGIAFNEVGVTNRPDLRSMLVEKSGQRTVPQIFFGEKSIGGFTDLQALDASGQLDELLNSK